MSADLFDDEDGDGLCLCVDAVSTDWGIRSNTPIGSDERNFPEDDQADTGCPALDDCADAGKYVMPSG